MVAFLHEAAVYGANNMAERALRPTLVMRKITGGSRSESGASGAQAWATLASVIRTPQQQGRDVIETLKDLLRAS